MEKPLLFWDGWGKSGRWVSLANLQTAKKQGLKLNSRGGYQITEGLEPSLEGNPHELTLTHDMSCLPRHCVNEILVSKSCNGDFSLMTVKNLAIKAY